jgi:hypothetical protein
MTTLVYVLVDPAARGGDLGLRRPSPPAADPAGGAPAYLTGAHGPPLGADPDAEYQSGRAAVGVGDRLLLYTDGAVERRGESLERGLDRLRAAAGEVEAGSTALLDAALGALPGARSDDVAVVAITLLAPVAQAAGSAGRGRPAARLRRGDVDRAAGRTPRPSGGTSASPRCGASAAAERPRTRAPSARRAHEPAAGVVGIRAHVAAGEAADDVAQERVLQRGAAWRAPPPAGARSAAPRRAGRGSARCRSPRPRGGP